MNVDLKAADLMDDAGTPMVSLPWAMLLTAMAGGMGWGIRGQYGHETGAMIAGLLVALVLVRIYAPRMASLPAPRAVALCTVAMGIGGSETYGQTIGLTAAKDLVGNWAALRWGLLGLGIKGAVWIGFAGCFLGMGLSSVRYRAWELFGLVLTLVGLMVLGAWLFNSPYVPENRVLPRIYFSGDWYWQPDAVDLKPRLERWGGLLLAVAGLTAYVGWVRKDRLARNLALWGLLGGALGFPLGQCVAAFHAWNREMFRSGWLGQIDPLINWWNMMETTFGAIFGATLALGVYLNRHLIRAGAEKAQVTIRPTVEWCLIGLHVGMLILWGFFEWALFDQIASLAIPMTVLPIAAIAAGRVWPFMLALPITVLPIAAKTFRRLVEQESTIDATAGAVLYVGIPIAVMTALAVTLADRSERERDCAGFTRTALLAATWMYFGLNYAHFRFPWPWAEWTARTPNGIIFTVCAVGLTWLALRGRRETQPV